jgi:chemotaxis protein MotB
MSFGRKTYDGDVFGGSNSFTEWGNSDDSESKISRYAAPKRAVKNRSLADPEESPFADNADKDRYLITYADLITLLLGLFIILYAISSIDNAKYETAINAMANVFGSQKNISKAEGIGSGIINLSPAERLKGALVNLIKKNNYSSSIRFEENERGITVHILEDIMYDPGKAELVETSKHVLKNLAVILRELPNDIRIEGHTDNTPINTPLYPSNWHLSVARATSTAYYLMENERLNPDKISVVGYADVKPIAPNDTPEHRAQNRRVDIVIINK